MSRIQLRLVGALAALVVVVVGAAGFIAERGLRERASQRLERSLRERALLVREILGERSFEVAGRATLDALAGRAGEAASARVTLIASDGSVVGDSSVPLTMLAALDNHADRAEVRDAQRGRVGTSRRRSTTLQRDLLYMALPPTESGGGVVRLAIDLEEIDAAVGKLRRELYLAGAVGLVVALALATLVSWRTLRPVEELRSAVKAIAAGRLDRRLGWPTRDALGEIATSVNSMAEQLRDRLETATAEKEQLEAVLSSMLDGVLVLDRDGRIVLANPRLRELLAAWGELEGRRPIEVIRNKVIDDALVEAGKREEPVVRELEVGEGDPRRIALHAVAFPKHGPRAGTVAVFHDVTDLQRLEQVRRDFIANASHELRTPLTSIRGFADTLLAAQPSEEERRSYLEVILRNAERLGSLIDDLLELSRIESRKVPLQPGDVDLTRVAELLVKDMEPRLQEASLEVSFDAGTAKTLMVWADRRAVEQILSNLLDNAVKYTNPGGRISVAIEALRESARVAIRDTGIGIPDEDRARIFERFYRVDKARSRALGGTGLGLSIVKHLVQAMGGEIWVESDIGGGSCFTFTLPLSRADGSARALSDDAPA